MEEFSLEVPFGKLKMVPDFENKTMWFHARADRWSHNIYKDSLESWISIKAFCESNGFKYMASLVPKSEKIMKFQTLFGLEPHVELPEGILFRMEI